MPTPISQFPDNGPVPSSAEIPYSAGATYKATVKQILQALAESDLGLADLAAILDNLGAAAAEHEHEEYLPKEGGTMAGNLDMDGRPIWRAGRIGSGSDISGDYLQFVTQRGLEYYENGEFEFVIGRVNFFKRDIEIAGNLVHRLGRGVNDLGSTIFARSSAGTTLGYGALVSGNSLRPSDSSGHSGSGTLSGMYRSLGTCLSGNAGKFEKVAM